MKKWRNNNEQLINYDVLPDGLFTCVRFSKELPLQCLSLTSKPCFHLFSLNRECHRDQDKHFCHQLWPRVWHGDGEFIHSKHYRERLAKVDKHTYKRLQSPSRQLSVFLDVNINLHFMRRLPLSGSCCSLEVSSCPSCVFEDWLLLATWTRGKINVGDFNF